MPPLDSPDAFLDHILTRFYGDLQTAVADNYDAERFNYGGVDRSQDDYLPVHFATLKSLIRETESYYRAWSLLGDEDSKRLFIDLLRYRLAGHKHVRLPTNTPEHWAIRKIGHAMPSSPSALAIPSVLGWQISHMEFVFEGDAIKIDGYGAPLWPFQYRQYFYEKNGVRIRPEHGDHVIDAGAGFGDTSLAFGQAVGRDGWVYMLEMLEAHVKFCRLNAEQNAGLSHFKIIERGLSDAVFTPERKLPQADAYDPGFTLEEGNQTFATSTVDHLVAQGEIPRVDFIKMDIEGSEMRALHGAAQTLRTFRPKLAISVYHDVRHFYEVPIFIDALGLGYKFHLDHYTIHMGETVLYAAIE
ncbi:MAG: FkbM family methyltransferase [Alphaproteobacteria bacterium]